MKIPKITIEQLLEAGVHLGHKTLRWNPKMKKYIFGKRDSIHIIDLTQTLELTNIALEKVHSTISSGGKPPASYVSNSVSICLGMLIACCVCLRHQVHLLDS